MKYLQILGLATVAMAALFAFVGAGTASAVDKSVLCKVTENPCLAVNHVAIGTQITSKSTGTPENETADGTKHKAIAKPSLTGSPFGTIKCDSEVKGNLETTTTPTGEVVAGNLSWTNCEGGTATTSTGGKLVIHHDAAHNGTVTFTGFVVKVVQAGVPCYYTGEGVDGTLTGGNPAILHVTATVPVIDTETHNSSAFCPANAQWHATYEVTSPKPLYVSTHAE